MSEPKTLMLAGRPHDVQAVREGLQELYRCSWNPDWQRLAVQAGTLIEALLRERARWERAK